nr:MAG TPA: hypothetical protein [Caudoviricetes sp.]
MLTCYVYSTKIGEISDISKCFENFVSQALGVLTRIYAAELRIYNNCTVLPIHYFYCINKYFKELFFFAPCSVIATEFRSSRQQG